VSGTVPMMRRDGLQDALGALKEHRAGVLAVTSVDRLSREQLESMKIRDTVRRMGASIAYVAGQGLDDTTESRAMTSMLSIFAELERDYIAGRTRAALQSKRRAGLRWNCRPPFGWCWEDGQAVHCDAEMHTLREMQRLRDTGLSYENIARQLNDQLDRYPPRGARWHPTTVWRCLNRKCD
jgi:site-specific DNA recombinase